MVVQSSVLLVSSAMPRSTWRALLFASLVLTAFGAKLWVIASFGNATPFWDEWGALGARLLVPYYDSTLSLDHFWRPHNEHRLLVALAVFLSVMLANGHWDPLLQMIVNGVVHVGLAVGTLLIFGRDLRDWAFAALAALILVLVAVPYAWEATLMSMTHYYYTLSFGFIAICLVARGEGLSATRIGGFVAAVCCFLTTASGALVFLACALVIAVRRLLAVEKGWQPWAVAAVFLAGFIVAIELTPTIPTHSALVAHSIRGFRKAFLALAGWPLRPFDIVGSLVVNAPFLALIWHTLRRPPRSDGVAWVLLALGGWCGLQMASVAYGRAISVTAPRYLDMVAMGLIVNFACAALLSNRRWKEIAAAGWLGLVAVGLVAQAVKEIPGGLRWRHTTSLQQEQNVKTFLATGRFPPGATSADFSLPYPRADQLAQWLSDERYRRILPSNLQHAAMPPDRVNGERAVRRDRFGGLRDALLAVGPYLMAVGLLLFVFALAVQWGGRSRVAPQPP
jgi:hypothetical protein